MFVALTFKNVCKKIHKAYTLYSFLTCALYYIVFIVIIHASHLAFTGEDLVSRHNQLLKSISVYISVEQGNLDINIK